MERKPIISCKTSEVLQGNRCAVVGTVIQKDKSGFFVLQDRFGKVVCIASDEILEMISVGKIFRVVGMAIEKSELKAESILRINEFDSGLYVQFLEIKNKV